VKERGFTLLEVLVASVVMAIAITGLLSALSTSMRNAARLTEYDRAALLGRQKMDELLLSKQVPKSMILQGTWGPEETSGVQTGWRARITPFEAPPQAGEGTPILERVQLEIWWMNGVQRKSFSLDGFRRGVLTPDEVGLVGGP
jgi:general secretion pathway protein I